MIIKKKYDKFDYKNKEILKQAIINGINISQIAEQAKVSRVTIYKYINEFGLDNLEPNKKDEQEVIKEKKARHNIAIKKYNEKKKQIGAFSKINGIKKDVSITLEKIRTDTGLTNNDIVTKALKNTYKKYFV